ncbi:transposase [Streptomyces sp. DG2A-72]|uniref:transposase n=1 Tax=Streptomyces sp. DG2A-72 TaxID=3051386 RepID=UPI00265C0DE3|nr:transposase [Streptomyces sp. DG2A-72]MDO0932877.1 transposase [Streptomyces sp. DG2A-72]
MPLTSENEDCRGPCPRVVRRHFPGEAAFRVLPRVRLEGGGRGVVGQAGAVSLVETASKTGLYRAISSALETWRKPRAVHDPGKILMDVALATALSGDCLADVGMLRAEPGVFGPVASDPTESRLVDVLAAAGQRPLSAIRAARAEVRERVWQLAGEAAPDAGGQVIVDVDGVLVIAHSDRQDAAAIWRKTYGRHPLSGCGSWRAGRHRTRAGR